MTGWIRGNNSVDTGLLAEEIARLTKENSELRARINSDKNSDSLYSGLSYTQMEELLKQEKFEKGDGFENLFDYLMQEGKRLAMGFTPTSPLEEAQLRSLLKFRLIQAGKFGSHIFSDDGHRFYIKTISILENND